MQKASKLLTSPQNPGPLAGGEGLAAPTQNPAPTLSPSGSFGPQLRAPNLLLNQGPSEPCYASD